VPDLATHVLLPLAGVRITEIVSRRRLFSPTACFLFLFGSVFPDLLDKAVPYAQFYLFSGFAINIKYLAFLHTPLILLVSIYLFCFFFVKAYRKKVFWIISGGVLSHLFLDALQGNICHLGYMWFFPLSFSRPTVFNFFYDDAFVPYVPVLLGILAVVELLYRKTLKKRPVQSISQAHF